MLRLLPVPVTLRFIPEQHPAMHGIISNDWYDKNLKKNVNCVGDDRYKLLAAKRATVTFHPSEC